MITQVFPYLIEQFARIVDFVFNLKINENPDIVLGEFILTCAFIGVVVYFIFGSDFFPNMVHIKDSSVKNASKMTKNYDGYEPKHAKKD